MKEHSESKDKPTGGNAQPGIMVASDSLLLGDSGPDAARLLATGLPKHQPWMDEPPFAVRPDGSLAGRHNYEPSRDVLVLHGAPDWPMPGPSAASVAVSA